MYSFTLTSVYKTKNENDCKEIKFVVDVILNEKKVIKLCFLDMLNPQLLTGLDNVTITQKKKLT